MCFLSQPEKPDATPSLAAKENNIFDGKNCPAMRFTPFTPNCAF